MVSLKFHYGFLKVSLGFPPGFLKVSLDFAACFQSLLRFLLAERTLAPARTRPHRDNGRTRACNLCLQSKCFYNSAVIAVALDVAIPSLSLSRVLLCGFCCCALLLRCRCCCAALAAVLPLLLCGFCCCSFNFLFLSCFLKVSSVFPYCFFKVSLWFPFGFPFGFPYGFLLVS